MIKQWILPALALMMLLASCEQGPPEGEHRLYAVKIGRFYGYIDQEGKTVIRPQFAYAVDFSEKLAAVNIGGTPNGNDMPTDGKWGFINNRGKFMINPIYFSPPNGAMPYRVNELPRVMHDGYRFVEGLAAVWQEDRWIYISNMHEWRIKGARRIRGESEELLPIQSARTFSDGLACVYVDDGWGYIDKEGVLVIPPQYMFPVDFNDGFALVTTKDRELKCINTRGEEEFTQYRIASQFHEGMAIYKEGFKGEEPLGVDDYKLGLMNTQGHLLVEPQFDKVGRYGAGYCPVLVGSRKSGAPVFDEVVESMDFEGGKWGFVDSTGVYRINPIYDGAKGFSKGMAPVKVNNAWGYINRNGGWIFKPQFHYAGYFNGPLARVKLFSEQEIYDSKMAFIDQSGDIVWIEP